MVTVGRGDKASFWHSPWLDGRAPMDIAPSLYPLAWRKKSKSQSWPVAYELDQRIMENRICTTNGRICGALGSSVYSPVGQSRRHNSMKMDKWWNTSAKSVYLAQFKGSVSPFKSKAIWRAHGGKTQFFLLATNTSKDLDSRQSPEKELALQPTCRLCDQQAETTLHLCVLCPFALEVWFLVKNWIGDSIRLPTLDVKSVHEWWEKHFNGNPQRSRDQRRRYSCTQLGVSGRSEIEGLPKKTPDQLCKSWV